ncbi:MAG: 4Fe-4S dicluster domain-containing protein [Candidatus Sulfotelmatobacter sp.]
MNDPTSNPGKTTAFLTDATVCIGCKACEVACKEWNDVPADGMEWSGLSYDNTKSLGASTWRHVMFLEQPSAAGPQVAATQDPFRWIFLSDVCKHCENAGCLEACPTGAIVRTEFESVFIQPDICNGCGYCVVTCPFGVVDKRKDDGRAFKCTFCYDRQKVGLMPACATACPTQSIQFGPLDDLRERGKNRVQELQERGYADARVYDPRETSVGGTHAFFVILGEPENYNLPPAPEVPTAYLMSAWISALLSAAVIFAIVCIAFALY